MFLVIFGCSTLLNTWFDEDKSMWTPIFRRYNKNYTEI